MIGEKLMEEPKTLGECWKVFEAFQVVFPKSGDYIFENANQLVRINNEVCNRFDNQESTLKILEKKMELMSEVAHLISEKIDQI